MIIKEIFNNLLIKLKKVHFFLNLLLFINNTQFIIFTEEILKNIIDEIMNYNIIFSKKFEILIITTIILKILLFKILLYRFYLSI